MKDKLTAKQAAKRAFKDAAYGQLARIGKAVASPKRLELLDLLCQTERSVESLAEETKMTFANTSQHLQELQAARLVETSKRGRYVVYRLADPLVCDFFRTFRLLAEDRLAEIDSIRRRFFDDGVPVAAVDRTKLLQRVRGNEAIIIDVRPQEEYVAGHIASAVNIQLEELQKRLKELPLSKEIVAYCRGPFCVLAKEAVDLLRSRGYRASRLEDSVQDWLAHGLPVATGEQPSEKRNSHSTQ